MKEQVEELREVVVKLSSENKELRAKVPTDTPPEPEVEKILHEYEKKQFSWDLKRDYKEVREALKTTGLARQQDYSTVKNIYHDKLEKENGIVSERNSRLSSKIEDLEDKIKALEDKMTSQTIQSPTPPQEKSIEREETISMAELKPLERVIGAFVSVSEMLEKLLEKIGNLTKTVENQKLELNELHSENEQLRDELEEYKSNEIEFEM